MLGVNTENSCNYFTFSQITEQNIGTL